MTFAQERDEAIEEAVKFDKWEKVKKYSEKYGVPLPEDEKIMKAGIYKAAQHSTNLSAEIKIIAMDKCLELGFYPFMY